ncbi:MAG: hypothetical protein R3A79_26805 [Nannocystaceae bacterium]
MAGRQASAAARGRRGALLVALLVAGALGIAGLLRCVAAREPAEVAPAPAQEGPQLGPPRPVKPFAVDGARALPAQLPPLQPATLVSGQLPELEVRGIATRDEGHVTWLDDPIFADVLYDVDSWRLDGASVFYAWGSARDVLIRGGEVYTDVARQLGHEHDDLRCVDVRGGRLLLVTRGVDDDALIAWLFDHEGPIQRFDLGISTAESHGCEAHLREDGAFVVQADSRAIWGGERITHALATRQLGERTPLNTSVACTPACTPYERAPTTARFAAGIESALTCEAGVRLQTEGPWLFGRCAEGVGPIARAALDGPCCDHALLPAPSGLLTATHTRTGDVALRFDDGTIALWTIDGALGPRTMIAADLVSARAPALRLRGLPAVLSPSVAWDDRPPGAEMPRFEGERDSRLSRLLVDLPRGPSPADLDPAPAGRRGVVVIAALPDHRGRTTLGRDARGELFVAWRTTPPSPQDRGATLDRSDDPPAPPAPVWSALGVRGSLDETHGWEGLPRVTSLRVDEQRIVIEEDRVYALPLAAEPRALGRGSSLVAADGERLIACAPRCASIDPGLGRPVAAASLVSRSPPRLLVRDGASYGVVHLDAPREELPEHPFAAALREQLARRERERGEYLRAYDAWLAATKSGEGDEREPARADRYDEAFAELRAQHEAKRAEARAAKEGAKRAAEAKRGAPAEP